MPVNFISLQSMKKISLLRLNWMKTLTLLKQSLSDWRFLNFSAQNLTQTVLFLLYIPGPAVLKPVTG